MCLYLWGNGVIMAGTMRCVAGFLLLFLLPLWAGAEDVRDWFGRYYRSPEPERVVQQMRKAAKEGFLGEEESRPPFIGFLSAVMHDNPGRVRGWLVEMEDMDQADKVTVYGAAWFSGTEGARAFFKEKGLEEYLSRVPQPVLEMKVDNPAVLDMLWGQFMATGKREPVGRIITAFELAQYEPALENYNKSRKTEMDLQKAILGATFAAAVWSLESNCRQHPRVLQHCEYYFNKGRLPKEQQAYLGVILSRVKPSVYKLEIVE